MEGDLTQKVRDSIKKKLHNLNCYSDDLADYVMVIVANKKGRESMQTELSLFLDQHAASFTDWLYGMLDNLETDTTQRLEVANDNLNDICTHLEVLTMDVQLEDDQMSLQEFNSQESSVQVVSRHKMIKQPVPVSQQKDGTEPPNNQSPKNKLPKPVSKSIVVKALKRTATDALTDNLNPGVKSLANVTPVKQKKSSVRLSRQANAMLLLAAVQETNLSSSQLQQQKIVSGPTAESEITHSAHEVPEVRQDPPSSETCSDQQKAIPLKASSPELFYFCTQSDEWKVPDYQDTNSEDPIFKGFLEQPSKPPVSPHFIVALDGIDNKLLESEDMIGSDIENSISTSMNIKNNVPAPGKLKKTCRFLPACKNANCRFSHRSVPCKLFPKCAFGDKYHYIHQKCKYDTFCNRSDCAFMHTVKRDFLKVPLVQGVHKAPLGMHKLAKTAEICKFSANCTSFKCPFLHPTKCRFGYHCKAKGCPFAHPTFPSRKQLKWNGYLL